MKYMIMMFGGLGASLADRSPEWIKDMQAVMMRMDRELRESGESEVAGLLALMLLTDAREARIDADGFLVPLAGQDRTRWDLAAIAEGQALLTRTLGTGLLGSYQIQAAIAAVPDEAREADQTDWPQILALYDVLAPGWFRGRS
jgi:predicted RNA polymerase sigma factor